MNRNDSQALRRVGWMMIWWVAIAGIGLLGEDAPAKTWYVATNGNDTYNGTSGWDQAYATISNAVAKAAATNDVILVSNGVYTLTAEIGLSKAVTVQGFDANREATIINGGNSVRGFNMSNPGAVVAGLMVTNCWTAASEGGGGIYCLPGTVSNCVIKWNTATRGGGLYLADVTLSQSYAYDCDISQNLATNTSKLGGGGVYAMNGNLVRCMVSANTSQFYGGGVYFSVQNQGLPIMRDCVLSNNYARVQGGGTWFAGSVSIMTNCTITKNRAVAGGGVSIVSGTMVGCLVSDNVSTGSSGWGGGGLLAVELSSPVIYNCRFIGNSVVTNTTANVHGGGGIELIATPTNSVLRNCLVSGNSSMTSGGGIYLAGCTGLIQNCTVTSNVAAWGGAGNRGGGIFFNGSGFLENTIVYGNTSDGTGSNWQQVASGHIATNSCIAPAFPGTGNTAADPLFQEAVIGNYRLKNGSPGINAGLNQNWMTNAVDLDGRPRIARITGGTVDIGAYEWIPRGSVICVR